MLGRGGGFRFSAVAKVFLLLVLLVVPLGFMSSVFAFTAGQSASLEIGQDPFISASCATTQTGLCHPDGLRFDSKGNLWVVDYDNNRVLRYSSPFPGGEAANLVIGQRGFTSGGCATTQAGLCHPEGLAFDSKGNLWVVDTSNSRILRYSPPFANGQKANLVIGQPNFTSGGCATTQAGLCYPEGLRFDSKGNLWVADYDNNRVLRYPTPFTSGEAANLVIGQPNFTSGGCAESPPTQTGLCYPEGLAFDSKGNLWVADYDNARVLEYPTPFTSGEAANLVIGQPNFTSGGCATTQAGLCGPEGLRFDSKGNLWVVDTSNSRVLEYKPGTFGCAAGQFCNGMKANLVIGQRGFTSNGPATTKTGLNYPGGLAFDSKGNLWVADTGNNRILRYSTPSANGQAASLVIGHPGFTLYNPATTKTGLNYPYGLAFDSKGNLWVADEASSRVLRYSTPFTNGEAANLVIGQRGFTSNGCATTQTGLCNPDGLAFDSKGNLWVADSQNSRVLRY